MESRHTVDAVVVRLFLKDGARESWASMETGGLKRQGSKVPLAFHRQRLRKRCHRDRIRHLVSGGTCEAGLDF